MRRGGVQGWGDPDSSSPWLENVIPLEVPSYRIIDTGKAENRFDRFKDASWGEIIMFFRSLGSEDDDPADDIFKDCL